MLGNDGLDEDMFAHISHAKWCQNGENNSLCHCEIIVKVSRSCGKADRTRIMQIT